MRIAGRILRVLLALGFIFEVVAALYTFGRLEALNRFATRAGELGAPVGTLPGLHHLPTASRAFLWWFIAVLFCVFWSLGGREALVRPLVQRNRGVARWLLSGALLAAALAVPGQALLIGYTLRVQPVLTVSGLWVELILCLVMALSFSLLAAWLEVSKDGAGPAQDHPAQREAPGVTPHRASAPAPGTDLPTTPRARGLPPPSSRAASRAPARPEASRSAVPALMVTTGLLIAFGITVKVRRAYRQSPPEVPVSAAVTPGKSSAPAEPATSSPTPTPEPDDSPVLARFDGGVVTARELHQRTSRLPALLRGKDTLGVRQWRVKTLVKEKLLALEAARRVTDLPAWRDLPAPLQQRLRIRALIDSKTRTEQEPFALARARSSALEELGRELYAAAHVEFDTRQLQAMSLATNELRWLSWEREAALQSLRDPVRPLHLQRGDDTLDPCSGEVVPASASYDARCGCESLAEQFLEEDVLYLDLYLSGNGPNIAFANNFTGTPCRDILLPASGPRTVEAKRAQQDVVRVELSVEDVRAPAGMEAGVVGPLLTAVAPRLGECLRARAMNYEPTGDLHLRWTGVEGEARGVQHVPEDPGSLKGSAVETCLTLLLESWRMVGVPDGPLFARLRVKTSIEPLDMP